MKKNVTILIGLVVLVAVLYAGNSFMREGKGAFGSVKSEDTLLPMKAVVGQVLRVYQGENVLEYGFDIPETATTSIEMDSALVRVIDNDTLLTSIYMSYEGARGYSALDYINTIIAPNVSVIDPTSTSTIGMYEWQAAESAGSEWHIASVNGGKWLIVVENKKSVKDKVEQILESVNVK